MTVALGIDTGGTYTDAVLVEYETSRVLAQAKALTTRHNLAIGIREAMGQVLEAHPSEVCLVSLSTTLATNALVEGNGAPACALLIGYQGVFDPATNLEAALGTSRYAFISGGHTATGEEVAPLDLTAAARAIREHADHVAAFAVSGYFGTRNPAHELAVKDLVQRLTGLPVTCGHELTHRLDAVRRATTATLNARLIPLLVDLIAAVRQALAERDIAAPVMVVKGDGSLMDAGMASERPIETILSGPAASVVGAQHLAGIADVVVVDMGGTTTDIAVLEGGMPRLSAEGARVGRWRTMVEAIDVHTAGLGGDSHVRLEVEEGLAIGPRRVVPLSLLASEHPEVLEVLRRQAERSRKQLRHVGEFFLLQRDSGRHDGDHPAFEGELFAALRQGPCSLEEVYALVQHPELHARYLEGLVRQGVLVRAGFTPTDAAHVLRLHQAWNVEAARLGASILARRLDTEVEPLCQQVLDRTAQKIAGEVVTKLLMDDSSGNDLGIADSRLLTRALAPANGEAVRCSLDLRLGLAALGAPVATYFPAVARLLHAPLEIPEHAAVANAVGAVVGSVVYRVHALVVPQEDEGYRVHLPDQVYQCDELAEALAYAQAEGQRLALEGARRSGAGAVRVEVARRDQSAPVSEEWGDEIYLGTSFTFSGVGRPSLVR